MTDKELKVRNKCRDSCNCNDKESSITLIKEEFQGCSVQIKMTYGERGMKMYMGDIMWEDIYVSF